MKRYFIIALLAGFSLMRCGKGNDQVDTDVLARLMIESNVPGENRRDTSYTEHWDAFWFYADTLRYNPPTREDVLARRLRARGSAGSEIAPDGMAEVVADTVVRFGHLTANAILVVRQPDAEIYAWRELKLLGGLPELQLSLYLRTWKDTTYVENKWTVEPKRKPKPEQQ
jgi:hypothetical protein